MENHKKVVRMIFITVAFVAIANFGIFYMIRQDDKKAKKQGSVANVTTEATYSDSGASAGDATKKETLDRIKNYIVQNGKNETDGVYILKVDDATNFEVAVYKDILAIDCSMDVGEKKDEKNVYASIAFEKEEEYTYGVRITVNSADIQATKAAVFKPADVETVVKNCPFDKMDNELTEEEDAYTLTEQDKKDMVEPSEKLLENFKKFLADHPEIGAEYDNIWK